MQFQKLPDFHLTAPATRSRLRGGADLLHRPQSQADNRGHDHFFRHLQAATHDPIRAARARPRAGIVTHAGGIGGEKRCGHGVRWGRLVENSSHEVYPRSVAASTGWFRTEKLGAVKFSGSCRVGQGGLATKTHRRRKNLRWVNEPSRFSNDFPGWIFGVYWGLWKFRWVWRSATLGGSSPKRLDPPYKASG